MYFENVFSRFLAWNGNPKEVAVYLESALDILYENDDGIVAILTGEFPCRVDVWWTIFCFFTGLFIILLCETFEDMSSVYMRFFSVEKKNMCFIFVRDFRIA